MKLNTSPKSEKREGAASQVDEVKAARYRSEAGVFCIDIHLRTSQQLFDGRDPAPFRERDLDQHALEYLLAAFEELPAKQPFKIVILLSQEPIPHLPQTTILQALRSHFTFQLAQLERKRRALLRYGQVMLVIGALALVIFESLASVASLLSTGRMREILRDGLMITGWVALWRPLEVLLYDWWPFLQEKRRLKQLLVAEISVRYSPPPE